MARFFVSRFFSPPRRDGLAAGAGVGAFLILFGHPVCEFWMQITLTVTILCILAFLLDAGGLTDELCPSHSFRWPVLRDGLLSAAALYAVFRVGDILSRFLFPFASGEVSDIYGFQGTTSRVIMTLLLLCVIGPGEEIFWRGFLQRRFGKRFGFPGVILATALYAGAHLSSGNRMLVLAALVCGAFWGLLYWWRRSLWVNIVSHAAWDVAIFIVWPVR